MLCSCSKKKEEEKEKRNIICKILSILDNGERIIFSYYHLCPIECILPYLLGLAHITWFRPLLGFRAAQGKVYSDGLPSSFCSSLHLSLLDPGLRQFCCLMLCC